VRLGQRLAATFAKATNNVTLWGRNSDCIKEINSKNTNSRYLPGIELPKSIFATSNFNDLKNLDVLLMVTPAQYLRETLKNFDIKSLNCPLGCMFKGY
jgi:glycerol-3-phosphate dehydrogenase (NAD(P)+)